jgi:hypothetical protein
MFGSNVDIITNFDSKKIPFSAYWNIKKTEADDRYQMGQTADTGHRMQRTEQHKKRKDRDRVQRWRQDRGDRDRIEMKDRQTCDRDKKQRIEKSTKVI